VTGARVPMLDEEAAVAVAAEHGIPEQLARLSIFRVLLRRPRVARALADSLLALLFGGDLDARLRELVIMRIGWATGSAYEWTQHWRIALDIGCTEDDLLAVRDWQAHGAFGEVERAVLAATDTCLAGGTPGEREVAALRTHLGDDAVVELVAVIGLWSMVSTFLRSLDVPLEAGVEPWPPDGRRPMDGLRPREGDG
jgi:alkylhydroperoxidase family enzyme